MRTIVGNDGRRGDGYSLEEGTIDNACGVTDVCQ